MSLANFKAEIWSGAVLANLRKNLIVDAIVNSTFTGEIRNVGDRVHIHRPAALTVNNYTGTINYQTPTSVRVTILADQARYAAFSVPDIDEAQSSPNLVQAYTAEAGARLAESADSFVLSLANDTALDAGEIIFDLSNDDVYDVLVEAHKKLSLQDAPKTGRFAVLSPEMYAGLLKNPNFIKVDEVRQDGVVGRAAGFDILESNNVPVSGSEKTVLAGVRGMIGFADSLTNMRAIELEQSFAVGVSGLHVFGASILQPQGLVRLVGTV